jgi:hypothetical protein
MSRFTTIRPTRASIARDLIPRASIALSVAVLAACSTYGPGKLAVGQSEADARAELGEPTVRTSLPNGGTRLDYARGPYGKHTYRVELDASGKVTLVDQLLTEINFETLRPGWSQEQVRDRLGPPSETRGGWRGVGEVWSYRYEWFNLCRWFQVWMVDGRVREAAYAPDPVCDDKRKFVGL